MRHHHIFVVTSLLAAAVPAGAFGQSEPVWLQDAEIASALAGKTIDGRYASGRAFTERYNHDGRLQYMEEGATIGGRWSVTAGTLCTIYDADPAGGCFRVARVSANCFEFFFASRTEEAAPGGQTPQWTARGSVNGEASACEDAESV